MKTKQLLNAASAVVFIHSLMLLFYVFTVNFTHPEWLTLPISHVIPIRTDVMAHIAYVASALGMFTYLMTREPRKTIAPKTMTINIEKLTLEGEKGEA